MIKDRVEMDQEGVETFVVEIEDIRHLLMAPPRDVYSSQPYMYMGQSVVDRLLEHFAQEKRPESKRHRLILLMPEDRVAGDMSARCEEALDRYTSTKIDDNLKKMAAIRRRGLFMIPYAMLFLVASVGIGILIGSEVLPGIPPLWATVLSEGMFIVGWVAMWGPLDTLLFGRFPYRVEIRALQALERMTIEIRAK